MIEGALDNFGKIAHSVSVLFYFFIFFFVLI